MRSDCEGHGYKQRKQWVETEAEAQKHDKGVEILLFGMTEMIKIMSMDVIVPNLVN